MNHFQSQHPNGQENRQNNLPGQMLNNYFQPAPQHDYSNGAFTGGPDGESGKQDGYHPEQQQHSANHMSPQYEQQQYPAESMPPQYEQQHHPSPERIGGLFPGAQNGNGGNFPEGVTEQLIDMIPEPPNSNGNGNGGPFPNWPPAPENGGNGGPPQQQGQAGMSEMNGQPPMGPPSNNTGNWNPNGGTFPNWPPAPSFPNFPENGGNEGAQGQQPAPAGMGGMNSQPPMGPPPNFVPQKQQVQTFAVDPGGIRHCMFRFTYIWPNHGRGFWAFPTFLGRNSIAGFRWNGFRWVYFGMDLNSIESFQCM